MNDTHYYEVNLFWNAATQGTLSSSVIARQISEEKASKFSKKIKEQWKPEHLSVAAVSSCLMSTFLLVADNSKDSKFALTEVVLKPTLFIASIQNESKAIRVLEMSEKA